MLAMQMNYRLVEQLRHAAASVTNQTIARESMARQNYGVPKFGHDPNTPHHRCGALWRQTWTGPEQRLFGTPNLRLQPNAAALCHNYGAASCGKQWLQFKRLLRYTSLDAIVFDNKILHPSKKRYNSTTLGFKFCPRKDATLECGI